MTDEKYLETQMRLYAFAVEVRDMPLRDFLERISAAESMGPVLGPTLYRKAHRRMEQIKDLAEALLEFQRLARSRPMEIEQAPADIGD